MTISAPLPPTERPLWFPGQLLTAADLTAAQDVETGLRRLHHRILHGWGVATGLAVTGSRGRTDVTVGAGYALDGEGRELVLPEPIQLPVPPVAGGPDGRPRPFALTLRWSEDAEAAVVLRPGECGTAGAVRRSDAPTLGWIDPGAVRVGLDVVLAAVAVQSCRLVDAPDSASRRLLNPPPTPYTATGRTVGGETDWAVIADHGNSVVLAKASVDTSEAGFGDTPTYLARVAGQRLLPSKTAGFPRPFLLDGSAQVVGAEPGRFELHVPLVPRYWTGSGSADPIPVNPEEVIGSGKLYDLIANQLKWTVEWVGVQP